MDEEVAKLHKANEDLAKELAAARATASTWEDKALAAASQAEKDRQAADEVIRDQATKYEGLEQTVFKYCRRILGKFQAPNRVPE
jgi:hypothetical protein